MITKVTSSPNIGSVCFTAGAKNLENSVNFVFSNLSKNRNNNGLGLYLGKFGKTNFVIEEKVFGKMAKISLINPNRINEIEISRDSQRNVIIKSLTSGFSDNNAKTLITSKFSAIDYKA